MVERQIAVAEVIFSLPDCNLIAASMPIHSWQSRFRIWLPWVQHVHLVLTGAYLAQILNAIIVLIAVNMVNLLLRKTTIADRPDGMVQVNKNLSVA